MAGGRLTVLVVYAATPWIVHLLRRAAGHRDGRSRRRRRSISPTAWPASPAPSAAGGSSCAGLVVALAAAFAPIVVPLTIVIAVCLALGTLLALASWRVAGWFAICGLGGALVGVVLNAPWVSTWSWAELAGAPPLGDPGRGLLGLGIVRDRADRLRGARRRAVRPGGRGGRPGQGVATDVGGACRGAGPRLRRAGRRSAIAGRCRSTCPRPACCWCRSPSVWRSSAAAVFAGIRSRRPRRPVRVASAARGSWR